MKKLFSLICFSLFFSSSAWAQNHSQMIGGSFAPLVEKLLPAVVNISSTHQAEIKGYSDIISPNNILNEYFENAEEGSTSLGSGFIIDSKGYIVTNEHVISNADKVVVKLNDNSERTAQIIGRDKMTDLALIKIDTESPLPFVKIGDSDNVRVGDWVLAIGNPFGLGGSVSAGIVSAKSRDIDAGSYDDFIQTDASINRGSSGGPMFNMNGDVVGINTALYSSTGNSVGIGFATPANLAKFVIAQLMSEGKVKRGWIGVKITDNSQEIIISDNETIKNGVVVSSVNEKSPAATSGIKTGDIIIAYNGNPISDVKLFSRSIAETEIGTEVYLRIWRNHQVWDVNVKIQEMPAPSKNNATSTITEDHKKRIDGLGISVDITDGNIIIKEVDRNSDAFAKGIMSGDIIKNINSQQVKSLADIQSYIAISQQKQISQLEMQILRDNIEQTLLLKVNADE